MKRLNDYIVETNLYTANEIPTRVHLTRAPLQALYPMLYTMKRYASFLIAGAACLPITYNISRNGTIVLSVLIVVLIAGTASFLTSRFGHVKPRYASAVFVMGAVCSSISFYIKWYKEIGYKHEHFEMDRSLILLESGIISTIGVLTVFLSLFFLRKYISRQ